MSVRTTRPRPNFELALRLSLGASGVLLLVALGMTVASARAWPYVSVLLTTSGTTYLLLATEVALVSLVVERAIAEKRGGRVSVVALGAGSVVAGACGVLGVGHDSAALMLASSVAALVAGGVGLFGSHLMLAQGPRVVGSTLVSLGVVIAAACAGVAFAWAVVIQAAARASAT